MDLRPQCTSIITWYRTHTRYAFEEDIGEEDQKREKQHDGDFDDSV